MPGSATVNSYSASSTPKAAVFGQWKVDLEGNMDYLGHSYPIPAERLSEADWFIHMFEKTWIDLNDFIPAYMQACKNAGMKTLPPLKLHY